MQEELQHLTEELVQVVHSNADMIHTLYRLNLTHAVKYRVQRLFHLHAG